MRILPTAGTYQRFTVFTDAAVHRAMWSDHPRTSGNCQVSDHELSDQNGSASKFFGLEGGAFYTPSVHCFLKSAIWRQGTGDCSILVWAVFFSKICG